MSVPNDFEAQKLLDSVKEYEIKESDEGISTPCAFSEDGSRYLNRELAKFELSNKGVDAERAYQVIHDILDGDGKESQNVAGFSHTWAPKQAIKLCVENLFKNFVEHAEYPQTEAIHERCIKIIAHLWHASNPVNGVGTATIGSSEGVLLGGLAMKKIWQAKRRESGESIHVPGPNIVMGANAEVALQKFAAYFEVEMRLVPVSEGSNYGLDPQRAMQYVDENTIGVYLILGSPYAGHYEPVKEMADMLDRYESDTGISVPIHVDAASGGFLAPFVHPELLWDFRIPRVVSINASGHKFGLSCIGCGWVVWRDRTFLPQEMIFEMRYLGSVQQSFSLNLSRPAHPIIHQYFNFIQLGFGGYKTIGLADYHNARLLSRALEKSGYFKVISDIHRKKSDAGKPRTIVNGYKDAKFEEYIEGLPLVSFCWSDDFKRKYPNLKQKWVQTLLRTKGWIVPNYNLPSEFGNQEVLRIVVRESISEELIGRIFTCIMDITKYLIEEGGPGFSLETCKGEKTA